MLGNDATGRERVAAMASVTSGPRGANLRLLKFADVGFSSAGFRFKFGCRGVGFIPKLDGISSRRSVLQ